MKKTLISIMLALAVGSAHAGLDAGLYVSDSSAFQTTDGFAISQLTGEQSFVFGTLMTAQAGTLTFSFLGSEAGHKDYFFSLGSTSGSSGVFYNNASINADFTQAVSANQLINFTFYDASSNKGVSNGDDLHLNRYLQNEFGLKRESDYSYLLLYNDYVKKGDKDFDDMVVRVALAPIPEPETYAMFLAGLGLMGFIARRRKAS